MFNEDGAHTRATDKLHKEIAALKRDKAVLYEELHALKLEVMGGEDVPGSAHAVTLEDVAQEMSRLRDIEHRYQGLCK